MAQEPGSITLHCPVCGEFHAPSVDCYIRPHASESRDPESTMAGYGPVTLTMYDVADDRMRPATQADIDEMVSALNKLAAERNLLRDHLKGAPGFSDYDARKFALTLADKTGGEGSASKGVVSRAENYLAFLKGEKLTDEQKSGDDR